MTCTRMVYNSPEGIVEEVVAMGMEDAVADYILEHKSLEAVYSIRRIDTGTYVRPEDKTPHRAAQVSLRENLK